RGIRGVGGGGEQPTCWGETRPHPMAAVRDAVTICRGMWRGEEVTFDGTVLRVRGARMNFATRPDIPILIAGRGRGMLRVAGEIADVVHMASWFINVTDFQANLAVINEGAARAGRQPGSFEIDVSIPVGISA